MLLKLKVILETIPDYFTKKCVTAFYWEQQKVLTSVQEFLSTAQIHQSDAIEHKYLSLLKP